MQCQSSLLTMTMSTNSTMVLKSSANTLDQPISGSSKKKSYKLREASVKKREEVETRKNQPRKRGPKPRPKTAPMSKYRRRTANLRERLRMGEINVAFEKLRDKLPNPMAQAGKTKCEKLTKINILHVAINYIRAMENLLETGDSGVASFSEMTKNPLRDESDRKAEMQRILTTLMARADKVHHQARSKKSSGIDFLDDDDEEEEEDEDGEESSSGSDENEDHAEMEDEDEDDSWKPHHDPGPVQGLTDSVPILSPDTSWTSIDSGNSSSLTNSDPTLFNQSSKQTLNHNQQHSNNNNNNNEDIMKDFTEFVDLVDSLHGMPDIDFEDNFEMFPC